MLELKHVVKRYDYQKVLDDIEMTFPDVGMIGIVGPSGCGKSTLLHIIGGIDRHFLGDLCYEGKSIKRHLLRYRRKSVSFVFQRLHLIPWLSVLKNIELAESFDDQKVHENVFDIHDWKALKISSLSLGQRQRIAYLRGCHHYKKILLCDEPTGSLDPKNAYALMNDLKQESKERLVIVVSHDLNLVNMFCDEIYSMKDGKIVDHKVLSEGLRVFSHYEMKKKVMFSHWRMAIASLKYYRKRMVQLVMGLSISLICILVTLTVASSFEEKISEYLSSLIPPSSLSVQGTQQHPLTMVSVEGLKENENVERVQLFLDDYELLGIGFHSDHYEESQTLFISDDSSPYDHRPLLYGDYPKENHEIVVSLSTAQHLCGNEKVKDLLGKGVFAWYKKDLKVEAIQYKVVGITKEKTNMDVLYQRENAYIDLIQRRDGLWDVRCQLGIIFVNRDKERSEVMKQLKYDYPELKFVETGASTMLRLNQTMDQIKIILYVFSSLALLSSLFLIGEVMFLNVIQKKKDFAIMSCYGGGRWDFILCLIDESILIMLFSIGIVFIVYQELLKLLNEFLLMTLVNETMVLSFDLSLFLGVCLIGFLLVMIAQIIPMISMMKMNTVEALKD